MSESTNFYEVSYENRPDYLYAYIKGDPTRSLTKVGSWDEIITRCRTDGIKSLLVVLDGPGNESEIEAFECAREIVDLGLRGIKIAYVDLDVANYANNLFGELVVGNRGANAKVFTTEAEALNWLLGAKRPRGRSISVVDPKHSSAAPDA